MARIDAFNPQAHEAHQAFDPLPAGWYPMVIVKDEMTPTKDDPQQAYLAIDFVIAENMAPQHKGRQAWERLNLYNKNPKAVQIANGKLSAICKALGYSNTVTDTSVLWGKPLAVKLKVVHEQGYDPKNEISGYDSIAARFPGGAVAQAQHAPQATRQGPPPQAGASPATPGTAPANTAPSTPPWGGAPQQPPHG